MNYLNKILSIKDINKIILSFKKKKKCKKCNIEQEYLYLDHQYCLYCITTFKSCEFISFLRNKKKYNIT